MEAIMKHRYRSRPSAFTLIELLLVLVILAVLAGIVIPKFTGRADQARQTAAKTQISSFETALETFETDTGRYPSESDGGLQALVVQPQGVQNWHQSFKDIPNDPWGHAYVYKQPGTHNPNSYDVYSLGTDGREGNDDIGNWDPTKG